MATYGSTTTTSKGGNVSMNIAAGYGTVSRSGNSVTAQIYGKMWKSSSTWSSNEFAIWVPSGGTRKSLKSSGSAGTGTYEGYVSYTFSVGVSDTSKTVTVGFGWNAWTSTEGAQASVSVPFSAGASYTISYNANGGSGAPGNQTKWNGVNLTLSSTKCTKANTTAAGYTVTFNGNGGTPSKTSQAATDTTSYTHSKWNTNSAGTGTDYALGGTYTANSAATLYAKYTSSTTKGSVTTATATRSNGTATRTVTLDANGGASLSPLTSTATVTYSCNGWYTATSGGTKRCDAGGSYTPSGSETVYAQWSSFTGTYSAVNLPVPTRDGYIFNGWATSKDATSGVYGSYTPTGNVTLYAIWTAGESAVLHFKENGQWVHGIVYYKENGQWIRIRRIYTKENGVWVQGRNSITHQELSSYTHAQLANLTYEQIQRGCV